MDTRKKQAFITNIFFYAIVLLLVYVVFKYVIGYILPFVVAFIVSMLLKPVVLFIHKKLKAHRSLAAIIVLILFYSTVGLLLSLIGIRLFSSLKDLFISLPSIYTNQIEPVVYNLMDKLSDLLLQFSPNASDVSEITFNLPASLGNIVSSLSMSAVSAISQYATKIPSAIVQTLIAVIASFFITLDFEGIVAFIKRQLPENIYNVLSEAKQNLKNIVGQYLRSYALIMFITFSELCIGFFLMGIDNAFLLAVLIATLDVLPVLGVGGVLIPWTLFLIFTSNFPLAIAMGITYGVITVVRNIIEPKIVGKNVGLPPIVALVSMFLGAAIFGIFGLFLLPISVAILKSLNDSGTLKIYK